MDNLSDSISLIKDDLNIFEENLKNIILNSDNFLKNDLYAFLFNNPKRLRPIFVYLFAKVLNISDAKVNEIALVSELIHNASLIHDDIIDSEALRRNMPTFYQKFGSKIAVLEGDLLLSLALKVLSGTCLDILKIYSDYVYKTINGEIEQYSLSDKIPNEKQYLNKTFNKTSNLFLCGLESLFTLKKTDETLKKPLVEFMKNYSLAFQIKNDIDNILYKNSTDIKNGNYTLPVIYFCMENDINILNSINIDKFNKNANIYIQKAKSTVTEYKTKALDNLNAICDNDYKNTIIELVKYTFKE